MFKDNPAANAVLVVVALVAIATGGYLLVTRIKSKPYQKYQQTNYKSTASAPIVDRKVLRNEQPRLYGLPATDYRCNKNDEWDISPLNPVSPLSTINPLSPLHQSGGPAYEGHGRHTSCEPSFSDHHDHSSGSSYNGGSHDYGSSDPGGSGSCD